MIKCAVIGASVEAIPMIELAHQNNIFVIGLDGNSSAEGLKFVDKKIVIDLKEKDKVTEILRRENINFVLPVPVGNILTTIGYVNENLKLPGINYTAAILCTDKYKFHKILNQNGMRNIKSQIVTADFNYENLLYPQIIKPRFGSGSSNVKVVYTAEEAFKFIKNLDDSEEFIIEDVFDGEEYGVDGAVINNELYVTLVRKKQITKPPYKQATASITVDKNNILYLKIEEQLKNILKCLNINNCIINADILINNEQVFPIELTGRPSGHNINKNLLPMATGINLIQEFINYSTGNKYNFVSNRIEMLAECFFDFENVIIKKLPNSEKLKQYDWLKYYECNINEGEYLPKVIDGKSIMGRGNFIISGNSEFDLERKKEIIINEFIVDITGYNKY